MTKEQNKQMDIDYRLQRKEGFVTTLREAMVFKKAYELALNIPPVIECVQFDADEIIAFLNDCKTLDEAKMFADEHLR